jgi:proteasome lid subunit RPN8/RPN11
MPFVQPPAVVVIAQPVRDSINAIWLRNNVHWNELADQNTLTQMLGTGKPTQREYMGCLVGHVSGDTVYVTDWLPARHMHQLQFAVTGSCKEVTSLVGTWHTHPYRADTAGKALKEPALSSTDLSTFGAGTDRVVLAAWDADSIDAAVRVNDGHVSHPALVLIR